MKLGIGLICLIGGLGSLTGLWFSACGNFTIDPVDPPPSGLRRLYMNDGAAADSLSAALVRSGVKFVLQPGKNYQISVETARTTDRLSVSYYSNGAGELGDPILATSIAGQEVFNLASDRSKAQFFIAQLLVADGIGAINSLGRVSLTSQVTLGPDTLNLRLLFIRKLTGLRDSTAKATFARAFFSTMGQVFRPYGITLKGSFEIVEPTKAPMVFPFSNKFVDLPGKRNLNHAHIYLVDSITIGDPKSGLVGQVLGFAPREVVDLDLDKESRVLLANPYTYGGSVSRLAITASHELGHFFGLRHTISTRHDLLQDFDSSNTEDGFTDTKTCNLDQGLAKRGAREPGSGKNQIGETPYCLRIADNSCNTAICDTTILANLMHPVDCESLKPVFLSPQQVEFLKKNLATYRP